MIHSGLVSVTFRPLGPEEIVNLVAQAGLDAIEWGGDVHVPPGDADLANRVAELTRSAGLSVSSYGSYYRPGAENEHTFKQVLETAKLLEAPTVRVWAGDKGSADADQGYRDRVVEELCCDAAQAAEEDVTVSLEFHGNTLTDTIGSADRLFEELRENDFQAAGNIYSYWQTPVGMGVDEAEQILKRSLDRLSNVHVFYWVDRARLPLAEGADAWARYLAAIRSTGRDHYALIEFVRDGTPEQFLDDARALKQWLADA